MAIPSPLRDRYTYGDYLRWPGDERWEVIEGVPYNMSPGPSRRHQQVLGRLFRQIDEFLEGRSCEVYMAPFDVPLPEADEADEEITTVVQPDLFVVCDLHQLDERGCRGAPDFVIEILSPATAARDQIEKAALYEKHGVKEYWTVHPVDGVVYVQQRDEEGRFGGWDVHDGSEELAVASLPGLVMDFKRVFVPEAE